MHAQWESRMRDSIICPPKHMCRSADSAVDGRCLIFLQHAVQVAHFCNFEVDRSSRNRVPTKMISLKTHVVIQDTVSVTIVVIKVNHLNDR